MVTLSTASLQKTQQSYNMTVMETSKTTGQDLKWENNMFSTPLK